MRSAAKRTIGRSREDASVLSTAGSRGARRDWPDAGVTPGAEPRLRQAVGGWRTPRHNGRAAGLRRIGVSGIAQRRALRDCGDRLGSCTRRDPNVAEHCRGSNEPGRTLPSPAGAQTSLARALPGSCRTLPSPAGVLSSFAEPRRTLLMPCGALPSPVRC